MNKRIIQRSCSVALSCMLFMAMLAIPAFAYSPPPEYVNEDIADGLVYYQATGVALYETVYDSSDIDNRPIFRVAYLGETRVYTNTGSGVYSIQDAYVAFGAQTYYASNPDGTITTARYIEITNASNQTLMWYNPSTQLFTFTFSNISPADIVYFAYNPDNLNVYQSVYSQYLGLADYTYFYDVGLDVGYNNGFQDGYEQGEEDAYDIGYDEGYMDGYSAGELAGYEGFTIKDLMNAVVSAPVNMVRSMLNVEVLGFNLSGVFFGLITLCILITVVVIIFKVAK